MPEKEPMQLYADGKGKVPCPKNFSMADIGDCAACRHKWAFGAEKGTESVDCSYTMEMSAKRLKRFVEYRDFQYAKIPEYVKDPEEEEVNNLVDDIMSHVHPHQRSDID